MQRNIQWGIQKGNPTFWKWTINRASQPISPLPSQPARYELILLSSHLNKGKKNNIFSGEMVGDKKVKGTFDVISVEIPFKSNYDEVRDEFLSDRDIESSTKNAAKSKEKHEEVGKLWGFRECQVGYFWVAEDFFLLASLNHPKHHESQNDVRENIRENPSDHSLFRDQSWRIDNPVGCSGSHPEQNSHGPRKLRVVPSPWSLFALSFQEWSHMASFCEFVSF